MVCACIDIGSNTTRLLVAETRGSALRELASARAFTRIGQAMRAGVIPAATCAAVAEVAAAQRAQAERAGASLVRAVATAAIRRALNRDEFCDAIRDGAGLEVEVLTGEQEAGLAFLGAAATLDEPAIGPLAVVDVGGGSTEIAVGVGEEVTWSVSLPVGSSAPDGVAEAFAGLRIPTVDRAVAVGGSAASLRRVVGPVLDAGSAERALAALEGPVAVVAARLALDPERVRLLPAGVTLLAAAAHALGRPLELGCGGLREGVLLTQARAAG